MESDVENTEEVYEDLANSSESFNSTPTTDFWILPSLNTKEEFEDTIIVDYKDVDGTIMNKIFAL